MFALCRMGRLESTEMTKTQAQKALAQIESKIEQLEERDSERENGLNDFDEELLSLLEEARDAVTAVVDHYESK